MHFQIIIISGANIDSISCGPTFDQSPMSLGNPRKTPNILGKVWSSIFDHLSTIVMESHATTFVGPTNGGSHIITWIKINNRSRVNGNFAIQQKNLQH
jgi:hypothetical protein